MPPGPSVTGAHLTTLGVIALLVVVLETSKGPLGLFWELTLAAMILALLLLNYQQILPAFISLDQSQTQG